MVRDQGRHVQVINGFYMNMRSKFTAPGTSIYYYEAWPLPVFGDSGGSWEITQ